MPRALKACITNLGFFELAVAAPSMKAALEAWGMSHNAFQHGFAKQTDDAEIIQATMSQPGVVLKRAVGSSDPYTQNAALPRSLPAIRPVAVAKAHKQTRRAKRKDAPPPQEGKAAILSFEKARANREKERAKEEAQLLKERAAKQRLVEQAEVALEAASQRHQREVDIIDKEREKLDRRATRLEEAWEAERKKLEDAIARARRR